jgi:hypothetical protein
MRPGAYYYYADAGGYPSAAFYSAGAYSSISGFSS